MEGALADDDLGPVDALVVAELARDLDRRLVGLEAGRAEERRCSGPSARTAWRPASPAAAPGSSWTCGSACRPGRRWPPPACGWAWPSVLTAMPPSASRYFAAFGVPDPAASAVRQRERQAAVGVHHVGHGGGRVIAGRSVGRVHRRTPAVGSTRARQASAREGDSKGRRFRTRRGHGAGNPVVCCDATMQGTIRGSPSLVVMNPAEPRQFFIQGLTRDGSRFARATGRSGWPARCRASAPAAARGGIGSFIGYSPYCVPRLIDNVKNVIVDER